MFTPVTEAFRKDLAQVLGVAPYRVEVELSASGYMYVTLDGSSLKDEHVAAWTKHVKTIAADKRRNMN